MLGAVAGHFAHSGKVTMDGKDVVRSQTFFDSWLICEHPEIDALVSRAVEDSERGAARSRIRKRRDKDREAFHSQARMLVANAAYALALGLEPPTIGISLARPSRRRSRYDGQGLRQINAVLAAIAPRLVTITRSRRKGIASVLMPGDDLAGCVAGLADFGLSSFRLAGGETIVVHRVERDYVSDTRRAMNVEYDDTPETLRFRAELERINAAIDAADLSFAGDVQVDAGQRRLRRIFNTLDDKPRFDLNGRLSGGWWENLERGQRYGIRIDGQPVADLDFSAMFLRLAYARAGLEPPAGDLYAGILSGPEEGLYRDGVKQVVNAMLSRSTRLQRLPKGSKELLPKGCTGRSIREAILSRHGAIRDQFEVGAGANLMLAESNILVAVLLRLIGLHIVALPMHDGLMVRPDDAAMALEVMREVSREQTGFEFPAIVKPLVNP
jgi:hypothetical protein